MPDYTAVYPTAHSDTYVKSTTKESTDLWAYYATDPALSLTGSPASVSWRTTNPNQSNQRFHIDLGSAKIVRRIYYENFHETGVQTDRGVNNFTFQGSNTGAGTFDDLVYANDGGWTGLTIAQATLDEHTGADTADPKYILVTNSTAYRYYAFKFADNHGDPTFLGIRHINLQTEDGFPHSNFFIVMCEAYDKGKKYFKKKDKLFLPVREPLTI